MEPKVFLVTHVCERTGETTVLGRVVARTIERAAKKLGLRIRGGEYFQDSNIIELEELEKISSPDDINSFIEEHKRLSAS